MRFMRIGDHVINLDKVEFIHFGTGTHVSIVFDGRVVSGDLSPDTLRSLRRACSGEFDGDEGDKLTDDALYSGPNRFEWNAAWQEAIRRADDHRVLYGSDHPAAKFLAAHVAYMRSKLIES